MIDVCARTSAGEGLYAALKAKVDALSPPLTYTPWVTIENTHRPDAESDLVNSVCDSYNVRFFSIYLFLYLITIFLLNELKIFREQKSRLRVTIYLL
jgi:hypothetical protein